MTNENENKTTPMIHIGWIVLPSQKSDSFIDWNRLYMGAETITTLKNGAPIDTKLTAMPTEEPPKGFFAKLKHHLCCDAKK